MPLSLSEQFIDIRSPLFLLEAHLDSGLTQEDMNRCTSMDEDTRENGGTVSMAKFMYVRAGTGTHS